MLRIAGGEINMVLVDTLVITALANDVDRAASAFAEDALLAYWDGEGEESAARTLTNSSRWEPEIYRRPKDQVNLPAFFSLRACEVTDEVLQRSLVNLLSVVETASTSRCHLNVAIEPHRK